MNAALFGPLVLDFELTVLMSLWLVSVIDTDDDEDICGEEEEEEEEDGRGVWVAGGLGSKGGDDLGTLVVIMLGLDTYVGFSVEDEPLEVLGVNDDVVGGRDGRICGRCCSLVAVATVEAELEVGTMYDGPIVDRGGVAGDTDADSTGVVPARNYNDREREKERERERKKESTTL